MAEAIARHLIESRGVQGTAHGTVHGAGERIFAVSAGTSAFDGSLASPQAVASLKRVGIVHDGTSKRLTAKMIRAADLVLGMTASHVHQARQLVAGESAQIEKIQPIDREGDVEDPIGMGDDAYDRLAQSLLELVPVHITEMQKS